MRVTVSYFDQDSFTIEEVVRQAVQNYGKNVQVECMPESTKAYDLIYFGLAQLISHEQFSLLFDDKHSYQNELKKLRGNIIYKVQEIIDQVIIDNESKVDG